MSAHPLIHIVTSGLLGTSPWRRYHSQLCAHACSIDVAGHGMAVAGHGMAVGGFGFASNKNENFLNPNLCIIKGDIKNVVLASF
ncbi:hypothetical protein XELAEV_18015382mg [Xenopus laevis]|uniref:Uncharacterized protein n=1 Tax=Xenopus laevis TaxID=8355 RepID=A0A974DJI2_XENLA|nr:hypothetical protein XELAEV_18015382mg [Xenopus laevis]